MQGEGGVAGSLPTSTAVHWSPNKLWRSNSIFNLCSPPFQRPSANYSQRHSDNVCNFMRRIAYALASTFRYVFHAISVGQIFASNLFHFHFHLRSRSDDYKTELIRGFHEECLKHFCTKLKPIVDRVLPMDR